MLPALNPKSLLRTRVSPEGHWHLHICSRHLVIVNGEEEYVVEEILILNARMRRKRLQYLVKWVGYAQADWMNAEDVNKLGAVI